MASPLDDIIVVEVDSYMASPSTGAILADLGARVIKIEPLSGDPMRGGSRPLKGDHARRALRGYDFQFDVDNRGKESFAVALDQRQGADLVRQLVSRAQVFMCNLLPYRQEKYGLGPASLFAVRPGLVHATLTGYGTTGPDSSRPGYDVTAFFGRSGLYDASREGNDGLVPQARPAQGDHTTGLAFLGAILAALRMAERTGEGQVVETSLYGTAVWTQASDYAVTAVDHAPVRRRARKELLTITGNRFPCGDGNWVVLNMLPDASYWPKVCRVLGLEHLMEDARFVDSSTRYRNMAELVEIFDEAFARRSRDEWGRLFDEAGLIWGPVLGLHEVPEDIQAVETELFPEIEHPELGAYPTVGVPMRFANAEVRPRGPAPRTGQHNELLLQELGCTQEEIETLIGSGIVGQQP